MKYLHRLLSIAVIFAALPLSGGIASMVAARPDTATKSTPVVTVLNPKSQADITKALNTVPGPVQIGTTIFGPLVHQPGACLQPSALPTAVDRSALPDATLHAYGLPSRPTNPAALASWKEAVRAAKIHVCVSRSVTHTWAQNSSNWAGNQDIDPNKGYTQASGNWNEPCLVNGSNAITYSSFWVGIGNKPLVQAGTEADMLSSYPPGYPYYYAWTENWPWQEEQWRFDVSCANHMFADISDNNCMYVEDISTGQSASSCEGPSADRYATEWIGERPTINGGLSSLADFGWAQFSNTGNNEPGAADSQQHAGWWMYNGSESCAYPGSWNNDSFKLTWVSYCN